MAIKVGELFSVIRLDDNEFNKGLAKAEKGFNGLADTAGISAKVIGGAFAAAGASVAAGLGAAVTGAANFEQALADVKSIAGNLSSGEMSQLRDAVMRAGADTKYSATEAAQGAEELLKAGVKLEDVLGGGLTAALNLATAGGLQLADAAEIASTALNSFKDDGLTVTQAADILAGAANASATSVGELKYGLSAVSAVAAGVGANFDDTATALAVFAQNGLKGSDAGTSLKTMLMNLIPKTDEQIATFQELGLMTEKGTSAFFNANGELKKMGDIAQLLQDKMKGMTDEQRLATMEIMFGSDAIRASNILFKEGAAGLAKMNEEMHKTTAADVAAVRMDTLKGAIEQAKGALETIAIQLGDPLLAPLTEAAKKVDELVSSLSTEIQNVGLQKALENLVPPEALEALQEVADVFTDVKTKIEGNDWSGAGQALGEGLNDMLANIGSFGEKLGDALLAQLQSVNWAEIGKNAVSFVAGFILGFIDGLLDPAVWLEIFTENWEVILGLLIGVIAAPARWVAKLAGYLEKIPLVGTMLSWLIKKVSELGKQAAEPVTNFFKDMGKFFMEGLGEGFGKHAGAALGGLKSVLDRVVKAVKELGATIYVHAGDWMNKMGKAVGDGAGWVTKQLRTLWNDISLVLGSWGHKALDYGKALVQGIWSGISGAAGWLKSNVTSWASSVAKTVKDFFGIRSPSRLMKEYGGYIAEGLAVGMKENQKLVDERATLMAKVAKEKTKEAKDEILRQWKELGEKIKPYAEIAAQAINDATSKVSDRMRDNLGITQAEFDIKYSKLGDSYDDKATKYKLQLQELNVELGTSSKQVAVLQEAYNQMVKATGKYSDESRRALLALRQEQAHQASLEAQVRQTTKAMGDQSAERNKMIADLKESVNDLADEAKNAKEKYYDTLDAAEEEYYQKSKDRNEKLAQDEQRLTDQYNQQLQQRADSLKNFVGLFDEVSGNKVAGGKLLYNLEQQVKTFEQWQQNIDTLAARGVDQGLIEELRQMGPKAAPQIAALLTLTDVELKKYVELWREKSTLAREEAKKQMEEQRIELSQQIADLRKQAAVDLEGYRQVWEDKSEQAREAFTEEMNKIEDKLEDLVEGAPDYAKGIMEGLISGLDGEYDSLMSVVAKVQSALSMIAAPKYSGGGGSAFDDDDGSGNGHMNTPEESGLDNTNIGSDGLTDYTRDARNDAINSGGTVGYAGLATGGTVSRSGMTWVGEKGPELLRLPKGSQVLPLEKLGALNSIVSGIEGLASRMGQMASLGAGGGATITVNVYDNVFKDGEEAGQRIYDAIRRLGL